MECRFEILNGEGGAYQVRLCIAGEQPIVAPFDLEFFLADRPFEIIGHLEKGGCQNQDLILLGTYLWNALRPAPIAERLAAIDGPFSVVIACEDFEASRLPWEALFDETLERYLANDTDHPVTRDLPPVSARPRTAGPLRMLVVVPEGSELDTASEVATLKRLSVKFGAQRLTVSVLDGLVTSERIAAEMENSYDIFHFIGHSKYDTATKGIRIRINADDVADREQWLDANQFADLIAGTHVRLAVFNSCESASSTAPIMGGLGRQLARRACIPAVIAMRYKIDDVSSRSFAEAFYRELLSSDSLGRVDAAVQQARKTLYTRARTDMMRSFITPVLYLSPGYAQLFSSDSITALPTGAIPETVAGAPAMRFDKTLLDLLRGGRCVTVIGPGVQPAAMREAVPSSAPTLLRLVRELATETAYQNDDELAVLESISDFTALVSPRIFQHVERERERWSLIDWLQQHCTSATPPAALLRIASWLGLPGIIYTHFDGLMDEALQRHGRRDYLTVNMPRPPLASSAQAQGDRRMLLFNLRGSLADPDSLVLTDADQERLIDDLPEANADVKELFRPLGRAVLFAGVSPFDPIVRRLARLYLKTGRGAQGPRYFVCHHPSAGDKAYWSDFGVKWIDEDPALVIEALHAALLETP